MKAAILQISEGSDIIGCIVDYAINNQKGITILSAFGSVRDVTLSLPDLSLPGAFHMLSLNGAVNASGSFFGDFAITLAGEGQLFRGTVTGKLVAASDVLVAAATMFDRPTVCSVLPSGTIVEKEVEDEEEEEEEDGDEEDEDDDEEEGLTDNE